VPDAERGRAFGAFGLAESAGQAVGMIAAGVLTGPLGLGAVLDTQGCLYLAAGAVAATILRRRLGKTEVEARSPG
jgi:hypothetical protein